MLTDEEWLEIIALQSSSLSSSSVDAMRCCPVDADGEEETSMVSAG